MPGRYETRQMLQFGEHDADVMMQCRYGVLLFWVVKFKIKGYMGENCFLPCHATLWGTLTEWKFGV